MVSKVSILWMISYVLCTKFTMYTVELHHEWSQSHCECHSNALDDEHHFIIFPDVLKTVFAEFAHQIDAP